MHCSMVLLVYVFNIYTYSFEFWYLGVLIWKPVMKYDQMVEDGRCFQSWHMIRPGMNRYLSQV